ncbi:MAG: glycosyltransferase family 2 protein [Lachnospiraceae bacterium]|nr:glycosyltransferase family 2 protein [Lachnospiraceae bacterium]
MITLIFTCFNRKEKTIRCVKSLIEGNSIRDRVHFIVVDDGSTDGTEEALKEYFGSLSDKNATLEVIRGDGNLFYSGGMRLGIERAKERVAQIGANGRQGDPESRVILLNDDVAFDIGILDRVLELSNDRVYVGPMRDEEGNFSYGGTRYRGRSIHYDMIGPEEKEHFCDTFNANFVVIPERIFQKAHNIDPAYIHSLGDFDYGLQLRKMGCIIDVLPFYAGTCPDNPITGTWADRSLSRMERFRKKESPKGAPFGPWFHFLLKNFGLGKALWHSLTPYLRILIGK